MLKTPIVSIKKIKVSILIISYNQQNFISEALESALAQDYENFEIVVSDDGSQDNTPYIISAYAAANPGEILPVLHPVNTGISANCNRGLKFCTGELIAWLGGDDIMLPGKIAAQVDWFKANPNGVLCGTLSEDFYEDGTESLIQPKYKSQASGAGPLNFLRRKSPLSGTTLMFKKSAVPPHGFDERVTTASDHMFCTELLMNGGNYGCVNGLFTRRRIHNLNVSRNQDKIFSDQELAYQIMSERYPTYEKECKRCIAEHVYYYQGVAKMRLSDTQKALELFKQALQMRPFYLKTYLRLIQLYLMRLRM